MSLYSANVVIYQHICKRYDEKLPYLMKIIGRIHQLIEHLGLSVRAFESKIGASQGSINRAIKDNNEVSTKWLAAIMDKYPSVNSHWLLTGSGNITTHRDYSTEVNDGLSIASEPPIKYGEKSSPFFDLPVTAGQIGQIDSGSKKADKYIHIPGVSCIAYFPVIGFSMEPTVKNGDIIGIDNINSWERLDPDKIYYIITHEDRMIKRLMHNPDKPDIITCYSDNYPPFTIDKSHIKAIYKVVFRGTIL